MTLATPLSIPELLAPAGIAMAPDALIMSDPGLRAVQHVKRLTQMGVHSLKIEGRTKSHFYCARTTQVYRRAIDDAVAGRDFDRSLMTDLESLAQRGYTEGFCVGMCMTNIRTTSTAARCRSGNSLLGS
jgi:collagenase-like PrtC family protease